MDQIDTAPAADILPAAPAPRRYTNHRIEIGDVEKLRAAIEFARENGMETQLALAFFRLLSLASSFTGRADEQGKDLIAKISDDGCPYSWRWWAGAVKEGEDPNLMSRQSGSFYMNGGLIYHGPGAGETFSVSLTSGREQPWQIHT